MMGTMSPASGTTQPQRMEKWMNMAHMFVSRSPPWGSGGAGSEGFPPVDWLSGPGPISPILDMLPVLFHFTARAALPDNIALISPLKNRNEA
jgi:hypothetical protein